MHSSSKDYQKIKDYDIEMSTPIKGKDRSFNSTTSDEEKILSKDFRWQFIVAFQCLIFVWLAVLTVVRLKPMTSETVSIETVNVVYQSNNSFNYTNLPDGTTSLDLNVDKLRLVKTNEFFVSIDNSSSILGWSNPILKVYEGDKVTWQWSTSDTISSCDSDRHIVADDTAVLSYTGIDGNDNSFSHVFESSGTFYYCSVITPSLFGTVIVLQQPTLLLARNTPTQYGVDESGSIPAIPYGVQLNLNLSSISKLDGCWEVCDEQLFKSSRVSFEDSVVHKCSKGDWLFMGAASVRDKSKFEVSAFGLKSTIFSSPNVFYERTSSSDKVVQTVKSNGVSWFRIENPYYDFHSIGFTAPTSVAPLKANWEHDQQVVCKDVTECSTCLTWGPTTGSVGCERYVDEPVYYRVLMTNTCPLIITPLV